MKIKHLFISVFALGALALAGGAAEPSRHSPVANVGNGTVTLDSVMEVWGQAWNEITAKAAAGKIAPGEVDAALQREWDKALETVIRDELFYQEAENDFERTFQRNVDRMYSSQQGNGARRQDVERRLRELYDRVRQRQIATMIDKNVKSAGGIDNLSKVLMARHITFDEWKNRIVRKAHTYSYLYSLFEPLGRVVQPRPREVMQYYRAHPEEFSEPGEVVFKQIFFSNEARGGEEAAYNAAGDAYAELEEKKIAFDAAVARYSDDPVSKARGGLESSAYADPAREGWLADLRAAAAEQAPGELGPVLVSPRGCHLVMLVRADPPRPIPYAKAQKAILAKMEHAKFESQAQALYQKLKAQTVIKVTMPNFPAEYRWNGGQARRRARRIGMQ